MLTGFLTRNIGWKLVSLGAAVALWISVASEPELATIHSVSVEYKGVPDDLEISSNFVDSVSLEMRGPAGRLRDLGSAWPAVVLDFSSVHQPGEQTFTLDERNVSLPRGIQLVRVIPAQLRFDFERRLVRGVPVEVRLSAPHPGYQVVGCEAIPPQLGIIGPQSAVDRTHSVVTDPVDISGVVGSEQYRVNTYLAEKLVRFQSSSHVIVRVMVKKQ
jgi:YbbR domain-containing protein